MKTSMRTGIRGRLALAGRIARKRARGVPIPERRHSLVKVWKSAIFQRAAIPIAPTTAIGGVALKMKRPAVQAMYAAMSTQIPARD